MRKRKARYTLSSALLSAAMLVSAVPSYSLSVMAKSEDAPIKEKAGNGQLETEVTENAVNFIDSEERSINFNANWGFHLGDVAGAEQALFDDSKWENVTVPHDYSITQAYDSSLEGESAYKPGGVAWYRKSFTLSDRLENKRIRLDFDGVYMNSTVYINGHKLGDHPYGYTPFSYDLTDYINKDGENVISVRVDHQIPSSRWYSGSGIGRDVKLTVMEDVHVDLFGTQVTSTKLKEQQNGNVDTNIKTTLINESDEAKTVTVRQNIYKKGTTQSVGTTSDSVTIEANSSKVADQTFQVNKPDLWSTTDPNLYTITTEILDGDTVIDTYDTQYGYRYFNFDKDNGFSLNDVSMKLNGVCMHHDQGALGSVDTRRAVERQVEILQEMGVNSIRTSHNPGTQVLHEVCAEKGIILMEEFFDGWSQTKNGNTEDYANYFLAEIPEESEILHAEGCQDWSQFDLQETIRRGRNNPAVVIWDVGNEVEHGNTSEFPAIVQRLINWIKAMDDRPFVLGDNKTLFNDTSVSRQMRDIITREGGLVGSNYGLAPNLQSLYRNSHPDWLFTGTENVSSVNSRGVYDRIGNQQDKNGDRQLTSYDYSCVSWGHRASQAMIGFVENDWYAGEYVWTGFDYLGEPTPWNGINAGSDYGWPAPKNSYFGIVDTAGLPKDTYYFYRSIWKQDDTTLHMLPAWRNDVVYKNGSNQVPVVVYTNAHKVKLEFTDTEGNTRTIGEKEFTEKTTANGYKWRLYEGEGADSTRDKNLYLTWYVPYEDGTLTATAYDTEGHVIEKTVGRNSVTTFGDAAKLKATADRKEIKADGSDLLYVTVDVLDAQDNEVANAADRVSIKVEGAGELVAMDNGNSIDHQDFTDANRKAFSGKVVAIVKSNGTNGDIKVTAEANGLESSTVTVKAAGAVEEETTLASAEYAQGCYVRAGNRPTLPATANLTYTNGTVKKEQPIVWEEVSMDDLSASGSVVVNGICDGNKLSFYINVISEIGAVQNYSAAVATGTKYELPATLSVLNPDGSKLPILAPVAWEAVADDAWNTPGTVVVKGTADVLGDPFPVTASIAVRDAEMTTGVNVVPSLGYKLEQNIPANLQSDNIQAIKDGNVNPKDPVNSYNAGIWSNYNAAQEVADGESFHNEFKIYLDTAQNIAQTKIYFCADSWSMQYPDAGDVKLYKSTTGEDGTWEEIEFTETIGEQLNVSTSTKVKPYTYEFDPTSITVLKIEWDTKAGATANAKYASGISEVEMYPVTIGMETNSTTALESLVINGKDEGFTNTTADTIYSMAHLIDTFEVKGAGNASITELETGDPDTRLLYVESEDHSANRLVNVKIGKPYERDPETTEYDLPTDGLTATAASVYPGTGVEGPASNVLDNNPGTWFHTNWNTSEATKLENRTIDLTFDEPTEVAALRYLPRNSSGSGGRNGQIVSYKVQYKETADGEWIDISEGDWAYTTGWKVAEFNHPVTAKAVRLYGVHTVENGAQNDSHMSISELRLAREFPKSSIEDAAGLKVEWPTSIPNYVEGKTDLSDYIKVTADEELHYGTDYYFTAEKDAATGKLNVTLKGNAQYGGEITHQIDVETSTIFDTWALELTIKTADAIIKTADLYKDTTELNAALEAGKAALDKDQAAISSATDALHRALLNVRLIPNEDAVKALKGE